MITLKRIAEKSKRDEEIVNKEKKKKTKKEMNKL